MPEQEEQIEVLEKKSRFFSNIPLIILEIVILCLACTFLYFVTITTTRVQKKNVSEEKVEVNEQVVKTQTKKKQENKKENIKQKGYRTIVLFGVDSREGELDKGSRSDSIIIASMNQDTDEIQLVSVYRDTFLNTGNDNYRKCNAAYAQGGPEQAMTMLNKSMDIDITDYVTVGFEGLIGAIDALGGVEIDVDVEEISHLNNYQLCMAEELGCDYQEVYESGLQTLNGMQATAYCRIRYTKGNDFKRTERQRTVLEAMLKRAQTASLTKLSNAVYEIMPSVSTSLSIGEILPVLASVSSYHVTESTGFPFEDKRAVGNIGSKGSCIVPTSLEDNVRDLHKLFYNDENYEPSDEVKQYSKTIHDMTVEYLN